MSIIKYIKLLYAYGRYHRGFKRTYAKYEQAKNSYHKTVDNVFYGLPPIDFMEAYRLYISLLNEDMRVTGEQLDALR